MTIVSPPAVIVSPPLPAVTMIVCVGFAATAVLAAPMDDALDDFLDDTLDEAA